MSYLNKLIYVSSVIFLCNQVLSTDTGTDTQTSAIENNYYALVVDIGVKGRWVRRDLFMTLTLTLTLKYVLLSLLE